jgi:hypothetical protein
VSDEPEALLLTEICASLGVGDDTAEPPWLPLASLLTLGASGVTEEESDTAAGAAAASAVLGAEGVSIVVVTGGTSSVRSGADSCTADTDATATLDATALARLELSERRGCDDTVMLEEDAGAQPSSLEVDVVGAASDGVASAGGVACASVAPGRVGMVGIVPIESS